MVGIAVWRRRRLGEWLMWWKGEGGGQREGGVSLEGEVVGFWVDSRRGKGYS